MQTKPSLKTIAIDLTPIVPHGVNGGAKLFVIELIKQIAKQAPHLEFILFTHPDTHDELQSLEHPHVRRYLLTSARNQLKQRLAPVLTLLDKPSAHLLKKSVTFMNRNIHFLIRQFRRLFIPHRLLSTLNVDLLFCPFTNPSLYEKGIPTVCTVYDLQYKSHPDFFTKQERLDREEAFTKACRLATKLAAISNYTKETINYHHPVPPNQLSTIYIRMAQRIFHSSHTQLLTHLHLRPKSYLIYPANYWKHKNHDMLLTAFAMAIHQGLNQDIKLVCTGAAIDRQAFLEQAANHMELKDRVSFPGYLSDTDLATLMTEAAGLIYPSLYEGFGLPIIEAMANHLPVACSNTTALPEIAGNAALLFDPRKPTEIAQAILLLTQPQTSERIEAGLKRAKYFSDTAYMAQEYLALFHEAYCQ